MLCALHKYYVDASKNLQPPLVSSSVPTSPAIPGDNLHPRSANVRRAGSFGSLLDSPMVVRPTEKVKTGRRFGHKRSHSGGNSSSNSGASNRDTRANTIATTSPDSLSSGGFLLDPFEQLEMVWSSLQSWFDLLKAELERVEKIELGSDAIDGGTAAVVPGPELTVVQQDPKPMIKDDKSSQPVSNVVVENSVDLTGIDLESSSKDRANLESPETTGIPSLKLPTAQTSVLAAAIVSSAPSHRRAAFLYPSSSMDLTPSLSINERAMKRRSWHVERVTARLLSTMSPGSSLTHLPTFNRSISSDTTQSEYRSMKAVFSQTFLEEPPP